MAAATELASSNTGMITETEAGLRSGASFDPGAPWRAARFAPGMSLCKPFFVKTWPLTTWTWFLTFREGSPS